MSNAKLLALAITRLPGLRPTEKLLLDDVVGSIDFFRALDAFALEQIIGRSTGELSLRPEEAFALAERDLAYCDRRGIRIVTYWDGAYPPQLREIYDPPLLLFVRGILPGLERPLVSVVGTREPTAGAVLAAEQLAEELALAGYTVISGLARGIDAAAHRGAVRANLAVSGSAPTGGVLGGGIDGVHPASNRALAAQILECGGFLASEYPPGVRPAKYHFPARNRIISGLARGVVVVEAPARSGALITAEYALDQGRDLFVHRTGTEGERGAGSDELAQDGARIITSATDILEEWGIAGKVQPLPAPGRAERSDHASAGWKAGSELAASIRDAIALEGPAADG